MDYPRCALYHSTSREFLRKKFETEISIEETIHKNSPSTPIPSEISPDTNISRVRALRRRSSINFGSPLPSPKSCAERFYDFKFPLGFGATSTVYFGVHKKTKQEVAIKVIDKRFIINKNIGTEISLLKKVNHPNIVKLIDVFITQHNIQIIMELCDGKELFDEITSRKKFSENDAKNIIRSIVESIHYLHSIEIVHGDLKPENVIIDERSNGHYDIKIVDFGLSSACDTHKMASANGTLGYKAPEVFTHKATPQSDMWSIGVMTYILCCGYPPFLSEPENVTEDMLMNVPFWLLFNQETETLLNKIQTGDFSFEPQQHWRMISKECKDFIRSLLVVDPNERMSSEKALEHKWLKENEIKVNNIEIHCLKNKDTINESSNVLKAMPPVYGV